MTILNPRGIESAGAPDPLASALPARALQASPCLLRAEGLRKAFGGQVVLDDVDLEIHQGEVILLRGENGSGKTTLLNILTGNLEPDSGSIHYLAGGTPRSFRFPRRWWEELNPLDHFTPEFVAQEAIGRTWQDIRLFGSLSLRDNIAVAKNNHLGENPLFALFARGLSARREAQITHEAESMLARLGLAGRETSSADKISLGQSKRVAIARAITAGAKILFLDEPLAGLDGRGVAEVLDLLKSLVHKDNMTLVIIEHVFNQNHLWGLITTDWSIVSAKLTVSQPTTRRRAPHVRATRRAEWIELLAGTGAEILDEPLPRGGLLTRIRRQAGFTTPPKAILELRDLVIKRGSRAVIGLTDESRASGFNLTLYEGEIAVLQAPNGWGKSTLLYGIAGVIPCVGEVRIQGEDISSCSSWKRFLKGVRCLPSPSYAFPSLTVLKVLQLAGVPPSSSPNAGLEARTCSQLSGGERQGVMYRATLHIPGGDRKYLLVLDEPFGSLDSTQIKTALEYIVSVRMGSVLILGPLETRTSMERYHHDATF